jgi:hypothetical protein
VRPGGDIERAAHDAIDDALGAGPNLGASGSNITYRFAFGVVAAGRSTIAAAARRADDPSVVTVFGSAATISRP